MQRHSLDYELYFLLIFWTIIEANSGFAKCFDNLIWALQVSWYQIGKKWGKIVAVVHYKHR